MVKCLIAGDCQGKVEALFKRVTAVNQSAGGPFDVLLCVGGFFAPSGTDEGDYKGELLPYITGDKKAPVPTYLIGGWGHGSRQALEALSAAPESNIRYLGRSGVTRVAGLTVAFLDGQYNAAAYRSETGGDGPGCRYHGEADLQRLQAQLAEAEGDVDVLLTNDWPAGVATGLPQGALPQGVRADGAPTAAEAAVAARPRYHIAGGKRAFFARAPYLNPDLGAGSHATRFISLAEVGNASKQKWLHALGLTPASEMTPEQVQAVPDGTTANPYAAEDEGSGAGRKRGVQDDADLGSQDWRWQQQQKRQKTAVAAPSLGRKDIVKDKRKTIFVRNVPYRASEEDIVSFFSMCGTVVDVVRRTNQQGKLNSFCHVQFESIEGMERACQLTGSELMGRELSVDAANSGAAGAAKAGQPVEGCWFCLSNPSADVDLVASVGEECYLALDKGAISDLHVLVLPVEHFPSSLAVPASTWDEQERYLSALRSCYAASGKELVAFERYMVLRKTGGNHCHLNAVAVSAPAAQRARQTFERVAKKHGFTLIHQPAARGEAARTALRDAAGDGEYFMALLPDGSRLVHPIAYGEKFPLDYGRRVLADLAGVPERADWKVCKESKQEEVARAERFKATFKHYDIMPSAEEQ